MDRARLEDLLQEMSRAGATTLHLTAGNPPAMRTQGRLHVFPDQPVTAREIEELSRDLLFEDHRQRLARGEEVELLYLSRAGTRWRTTLMQQSTGLGVVFRRLPSSVPTLADLNLPTLLAALTGFNDGMIVLTGSLGSGKSTTLAAMVDRICHESPRHVITIEDQIEVVHESRKGLVHQREVNRHVASKADGVREAIAHGGDVVVVGDLDDATALHAMLDAVERGCLVLTTMQGGSIVSALSDLVCLCPEPDRSRTLVRLTHALKVMISQTLLQQANGKGRVPLLEILINNPAVSRVLRSGEFHELPAVMERHRGLGMQTVDMGLRNLLARNLITVEEARYHAVDRSWCAAPPPTEPGTTRTMRPRTTV
jgi:twitching motility protein PilT